MIAGRLGGRALRAPKGHATRPTTDRVRESLFAVLGDLSGVRVLDLYAGTGALGIEAASRGAAWVTFVEDQRAALAALRENLESLELGESTAVIPLPVERAAQAVGRHGPYGLVLADPPWADMDQALKALDRLLTSLPLAPDARVVVEHAARSELVLPALWPLELDDARTWGDTAVSIYRCRG